jgi:hypothetical protein
MENYEGVRKMKTQKKFLTTLALASFVCAAGVQADEIQRTQTKYDSTTTPTTVATPDYTNHYNTESDTPTIQPTQQEQQSIVTDTTTYKDTSIRDETLGVSPQVGVLSYTNPNGAYSARAFAGITGSFNFVPLTASPEARLWYVGVTTGVLFSHNGSSSSNFFGSNPSVSATDNSNILYIPADLKIGYNFGETFRLSAHGGGNIIYRSSSGSVNLGAGSTGDDSLWKIYPNVGGDLEWQVSKRVSILVRPDVTITPASDTLSATVGATFVSL